MTAKPPVFGKRGREVAEKEHKPTVIERLKKAASRLWVKKKKETPKKKSVRAKVSRR